MNFSVKIIFFFLKNLHPRNNWFVKSYPHIIQKKIKTFRWRSASRGVFIFSPSSHVFHKAEKKKLVFLFLCGIHRGHAYSMVYWIINGFDWSYSTVYSIPELVRLYMKHLVCVLTNRITSRLNENWSYVSANEKQ